MIADTEQFAKFWNFPLSHYGSQSLFTANLTNTAFPLEAWKQMLDVSPKEFEVQWIGNSGFFNEKLCEHS